MLFFLGCVSSLLDESQDFSIFDRQIFDYCCCCRCRRPRFIIVVSDFAHVPAEVKHDRTCLFNRMKESCTKMLSRVAVGRFFIFLCCCQTCFFFIFCSFGQVWALFRQSLPCLLAVSAAVAAAAASVGCRRPTVLTSMLRAETLRRFVSVLLLFMLLLSISCASASSSVRFASAATAFSLSACAFASFLPFFFVLQCLLWRRYFLYFDDFLIFFRARAFRY